MKTEKATVIGAAAAEQIAAWKKQYNDVYEVIATMPDTEVEHACYLRKPKRQELSYAYKIATSNPLGFNEAIVNACWLGGSEEIRSNDTLFMGVSTQIAEIIQVAEANIKKL